MTFFKMLTMAALLLTPVHAFAAPNPTSALAQESEEVDPIGDICELEFQTARTHTFELDEDAFVWAHFTGSATNDKLYVAYIGDKREVVRRLERGLRETDCTLWRIEVQNVLSAIVRDDVVHFPAILTLVGFDDLTQYADFIEGNALLPADQCSVVRADCPPAEVNILVDPASQTEQELIWVPGLSPAVSAALMQRAFGSLTTAPMEACPALGCGYAQVAINSVSYLDDESE